MDVNIKEITGVWKQGYSLDKHTISSTPIGYSGSGRMLFDTVRPDAGEALFQLKYRDDYSQVPIIAQQMHASFNAVFATVGLIIPMPPSTPRARQPVVEIAREIARLKGVPCYENLLLKTSATPPMKDLATREEKVSALICAFTVYDVLEGGPYDVLIIDDLFDTGSSLEVATTVLSDYNKIRHVYVATVTRKR